MQYKTEDWEGQGHDNLDRLRQLKKELTDLQQSGGKKYLDEILRARYHSIMAGIAGAPLATLDDALAQEYNKGQAYACLFLSELVPALLQDFSEQITNLMHEEKEVSDYE